MKFKSFFRHNLLSRFNGPGPIPSDLRVSFSSFDAWQDFTQKNPLIRNPANLATLVQSIRANGFFCPICQRQVSAQEITFGKPNYREGLLHCRFNSRLRAVYGEILKKVGQRDAREIRIYAPEALTPFALHLRGIFPRFIGSEYTDSPTQRDSLYPVQFQDLLALTHPSGVFDVVVVNDIFEHVTDIDACLGELARVTRPGGRLISTFPFNMGGDNSVVRARLGPNGVEHLAPPEYHDNPVDPKGSLVFEIPGWDILDRAKKAGWSRTKIAYESSVRQGILGSGYSGIFTLLADR